MKINWKVRIKQKPFLVAIGSALLVLIKSIAEGFGYTFPAGLVEDIVTIAENALYLLMVLGIVIDPTTEGAEDSDRAMNYSHPIKKSK
ncbi:phage holin [Alkalicoccobacillus murimartini]|uniref:Phi LC3 family holin n=1 Tax=Alkalicoccobacillus murimartini TaxID=171685 RepID=A0ABT9YN76_9BACI|nr:phage holin [Alkalicoccobacillus murimartini]MDQ0208935.1 phi LC3 family holin [Alkalicoccobacillus murimartini]